MNKQLRVLLQTNLLYANPQVTQQQRQKGKSGKAITRTILFQYVALSIMFMVIYGGMMMLLDFTRLPGYFTYYVALFTIMTFAQSVTSIFNLFYESKDLTNYLPLPFQQKSVFLAKFMIVAMTILPFALPILVLFLLTTIRSGSLLGIPVAIVLFALFAVFLTAFCALIVFGLTQTNLFVRHKKVVTTLLMLIPSVGMVGGILYLNSQQSGSYGMTIHDQMILWPFYPLYKILTAPLSWQALVSLAVLIILLVGVLLVVQKRVIPRLYEQEQGEAPTPTTRKHYRNESFKRQLWRYNFSLIKDPSLLMQIFSSTILLPVVMVLSFALNGLLDFSQLDQRYFGVFLLGGICFSLMSLNQTAIVANIISLDRQNFYFMRSLPISFKEYLKAKFIFSFSLQALITATLLLVGGLVLKVPVILVVALVLGDLLGSFLGSLRFFARDYKHLTLNWTNTSQLFNRGGGNFMMMVSIFGTLIVGAILIAIYTILVSSQVIPVLVNSGFALLIAGASAGVILYYGLGFWGKLHD